MPTDTTFEMAQALRRSHCDRRDEPHHECVGVVTIKRGEVCLDCPLCGKGEDIPGWSGTLAVELRLVFDAAGINWDSLHMEAKLNAIRALRNTLKNSKLFQETP